MALQSVVAVLRYLPSPQSYLEVAQQVYTLPMTYAGSLLESLTSVVEGDMPKEAQFGVGFLSKASA